MDALPHLGTWHVNHYAAIFMDSKERIEHSTITIDISIEAIHIDQR